MKKIFVLSVLLSLLMLQNLVAQVPLCPNNCAKLNPQAQKYYKKALACLDRVYYKGALEEVRKAAKADPNHADIHFFVARLARMLGRRETEIDQSRKYYTIAEEAMDQISHMENLNPDQEAYLSNLKVQIMKEKSSLIQRNERRIEVGDVLIMDYLKSIGRLTPEENKANPDGNNEENPTGAANQPGQMVSGSIVGGSSNTNSAIGGLLNAFGGGNSSHKASSGTSPFSTSSPSATAGSAATTASPFGTTGTTTPPTKATSSSPFSSTAKSATTPVATPASASVEQPETTANPFSIQ